MSLDTIYDNQLFKLDLLTWRFFFDITLPKEFLIDV